MSAHGAPSTAWPVGRRLADRYIVEDLIGEGGFGQVYRARQIGTGQAVAVKRLRLVTGPGAPPADRQRARFEREVALCGRLFHPNVVRVIDAGEAEGELFTVFEFVPGRTLAAVLAEQGRLGLDETLHLMGQVLDGLAAAHAAGVVHRDLKPHNIMVTETGARRNALILDFGTGALADGLSDGARLTASLEVLGTPAYAAPEQLRGLEPTPRTDLYAWGLIVLECLTGSRVIEGDTPHAALFAQLGADPIPLPPSLTGQPLGALLARVLEKDVERRDVGAAELLRALVELGAPSARPAAEADDGPLAPGEVATLGPPIDPRHWARPGGDRRQLIAVAARVELSPVGEVDPEVLDRLTRQQLAACAEDVAPTGARLAGALGTGLVWYFGAPAREDDARRAQRAMEALRAGMTRRAATLEKSYGVRAALRVGVHAARQVVGPPAGAGPHPDALGLLAGRALALADAALDGPRVSSTARRLLDAAPRLDVADTLSTSRRAPFVGRDRELSTLRALWASARSGAGRAALVVGEAGMGKSRLAQALYDDIEGGRWLVARCLPEARNSTLRPIVDLFESLLDAPDDAPPAARIDALARFVEARGLDAHEAMPLLGAALGLPVSERWPMPGLPPARRREVTFDLLLCSLFDLAERQPLVLWVDDLHWADPSTLDLLKLLIEDLPTAPVFALMTTRPGFEPPWAAGRVDQVRLDRLAPAAVEALIEACDAGHAVGEALRGRIADRTDGVPLFVEELTRMLAERPAGGGDAVPETVEASLAARLDALGPARRTARVAAVIGREFREDLLALVCERDPIELSADLRALVDATLVHRRRRARPVFVFKHALVRDAAYGALTAPDRARIHGRIGEALEARFPEEVARRPELLAHHFGAAGDRRRATRYAETAASAALHRSANVEAVEHARQAIAWLDGLADPRERDQRELRLTGLMTPALMASTGFVAPELRAALDRAAALIESLGLNEAALPILWSTAMVRNVLGDRAEARSLMGRVIEHAERTDDRSNLLAGLSMRAGFRVIDGDMRAAEVDYARARGLYDPERDRALAARYGWDPFMVLLTGSALSLYATGRVDAAVEGSARGEAWSREIEHAHSIAQALMYRCILALWADEPAQAKRHGEAGRAFCLEHGLPDNLVYIEMLRAWGADDIDALRAALEQCRGIGLRLGLSMYPAALAQLEARRGRHAEALALVDDCIAFAEETGEGMFLPRLHGMRGTWSLALDPTGGRAVESWRVALAVADETGAVMMALPAAIDYARWLLDRGDTAGAHAVLDPRLEVIDGGDGVAIVERARSLRSAGAMGAEVER